MRRAAGGCAGAALSLWMAAAAASAQSATGLELDHKPLRSDEEAAGAWSADLTVARLVYDPIKILGMGHFTQEGRIALKVPMDRAESRVREVMARLSSGAIDERQARGELADAIAEYRVAVRGSLAAR